jgi:hypothetical protein
VCCVAKIVKVHAMGAGEVKGRGGKKNRGKGRGEVDRRERERKSESEREASTPLDIAQLGLTAERLRADSGPLRAYALPRPRALIWQHRGAQQLDESTAVQSLSRPPALLIQLIRLLCHRSLIGRPLLAPGSHVYIGCSRGQPPGDSSR